MKKILSIFTLATFVFSMFPPVSFAAPQFTIISFTASEYVSGEEYTLTLDSFSDITDYEVGLTLENKPLEITETTATSIKGILPDPLPAPGGMLKFTYGSIEVDYRLRVPNITNILLPDKIEKDAEIVILGTNFHPSGHNEIESPATCTATFVEGTGFTVTSCLNRKIVITIGDTFTGGDIMVTTYGFDSNGYTVDYTAPMISFVSSQQGVQPGNELEIHGSNFHTSANANYVYIGDTQIDVVSLNSSKTILTVELPSDNIKGNLKIISNGIQSNEIAIESMSPPVLLGYRIVTKDDGQHLQLIGKDLGIDEDDATVTFDETTTPILLFNPEEIEVDAPSTISSKCIFVTTNEKRSNCIEYRLREPPLILGYQMPSENLADNAYDWTITGDNFSDDESEVEVYINESQVTTVSSTEKKITAQSAVFPEKGQIYIVADGVAGERRRYDFGKFYYPSLRSITAPYEFGPNQPIFIEGNNFGTHANHDNVVLSLSKGGLTQEYKYNPATGLVDIVIGNDWKITPAKITSTLDNSVAVTDEINMSITIRGKKSNDLDFTITDEVKTYKANPWLHSISYPEGAISGKPARIRGRGLSQSDHVYFDGKKAKLIRGTETLLDVVLPSDIPSDGDIEVRNGPRVSNTISYIAVPSAEDSFVFSFAENTIDSIDPNSSDEVAVTIGTLEVMNLFGNMLVKNMTIELEYIDDQSHDRSVKNYGVLPFAEIEMVGGTELITSRVLKRENNHYTVTFKDILIPPSSTSQTYEIKSYIRPFALDGAKFRLKLTPSDDMKTMHLDDWEQPVVPVNQSEILSDWISVGNPIETCLDTDGEEVNCDTYVAEVAAEEEAEEEAASEPEAVVEEVVVIEKPKPPRIPLSDDWDTSGGPMIPFSDIEGSSDQQYIYELKKRGVVEGFGNNDFQPDKLVNRAEFLKMTVAGLQIDPNTIDTSVLDFSDVPQEEWYSPYVAWALNYGVVQGYGDGTFRPGNNITRAEAIKIVLTSGAFDIEKIQHTYSDIDAWQHQYIAEAVDAGIIGSGNILNPNQTINRSESARLITLMLHAFEEEVL